MQGAISSIDAVERWFRANEAPFFTLTYYSSASPTGQGQVILRNSRNGEIDAAWGVLKQAIIDQTGFGRAQLNLIVYAKSEGANNPTGRTNIDILSTPQSNVPQAAGIGYLPSVGSGYISESDFERRLNEEKKKWETSQRIAALEEMLANPENDPIERFMSGIERMAATPLGIALITKITGVQPAAPITGHALSDESETPQTDDVESELDDLEAIAASNGMSLKDFLAKTAKLAKQQPGVVAMLAAQ